MVKSTYANRNMYGNNYESFSITGYPLRKLISDGPRIRLKEKK